MDKYECSSCGYIYDPEFGDDYSGIAPGTPFEELPADWICPMGMRVCICQRAAKTEARCGAPKSQFMRIN